MVVRPVGESDRAEWLRLRTALWPDCPIPRHRREMDGILSEPSSDQVFVAAQSSGQLIGFLEASLRPRAEGCETRPVGYVEGWYVEPEFRRRGVGRELITASEAWARAHGCREMASDCNIDNEVSLAAHRALGYDETRRLIHLRKQITLPEA